LLMKVEELGRKHEEERGRLGREWDGKRKAAEEEGNELTWRRREKQHSEKVTVGRRRRNTCSRWK
jgi:hypothetical protein